MWEIDGVDNDGCSANDRWWKCLISLTEKLSEGKLDLDQLVKEVEKNQSDVNGADHHNLDHGISKKNKNVDEVETTGRSCQKKSGLRITFKFNNEKVSDAVHQTHNQEPVSLKLPSVEIKKPCAQIPKESETIKNLEKNPISRGKRRISCFEIEEGRGKSEKKPKKKKSEITSNFVQELESVLPETVKDRILNSGGCVETVVLVIQKELYPTDVIKTQTRLSIPYRQIKNPFLISTDLDDMDSNGISVNVVQPCLDECEMSLRDWKSNSMYALVSDWNEVCRRNELRQGMVVQLWSFRRNSALCFALVRIDD